MTPTLSRPPSASPGVGIDVRARLRQTQPGRAARWLTMGRVGLSMLVHSKPKLVGTVLGVVIAVVLSVQQLGILFGLLAKNTLLIDNAAAEIWIMPPGTTEIHGGTLMDESVLMRARGTPGVRRAAPLVLAGASVLRPDGGSEAVTLVGTELPAMVGGPWNLVAGEAAALAQPDTVIFEDSQRERLGGVNLGSLRELNGTLVRAGGFTWGLIPFGPAYAFAEIDLARTLTGVADGQSSFVLVQVAPGADPAGVAEALRARLPETLVQPSAELRRSVVYTLLGEQLGLTFGMSTLFGLVVGFVIVALSMFSSVLDNVRELGTLKAIGSTNGDLTRLLVVQSVALALVGSLVGLGIATRVAGVIRTAKLIALVPTEVVAAVPALMLFMCLFASSLAVWRIRQLEPGMVFR
ncbi:ABC transporter permease [Haliangium sp.]|uniref:ABC transporter permease n=1 Tax=Haliangium sp. TaxID=2663208 RepID=UPI003D134548